MQKTKKKWIVGIDEAGRGPLAGPVSVGAVLIPHEFDFSVFSFVKDSKQLTEKAREQTYKEVRALARKGGIRFAVALIPASTIDAIGITKSVAKGIDRVLRKLSANCDETEVRLDGLLRAPHEYLFQKTIIKGDVTEPAISLGSIMAKVARDRYMVRLSRKYPTYGLHIHKGYGTKMHQEALAKYGLSKIHRKSFCKKFFVKAVERP